MQSAGRYIIAMGISSFVLSLLYFLSLVLHVPFGITTFVIFLSIPVVFYYTLRGKKPTDDRIKQPFWASVVLMVGLYLITKSVFPLSEHYGGWDGWGIWNLHAKYLADPANWTKMFQNKPYAHPDYPLYIPAVNGFFIRLFSAKYTMVIPFIFNFCITLFIPVLIYLESLKKNFVVASVILFLFAFDTFYLTKGMTQYADTPLAFFFLCAFVCINYWQDGRKYIALSAACLACCIWTKNEGAILALVFLASYPRMFFSKRNIKATLIGLGIPLLVYMLFKACYAPDAAIISGQGAESFSQLFIKDRYDMVWDYFKENVAQKYGYIKVCLYLYLLLCFIELKMPDKQFFVLLLCVIAYTMIYILKPGSIEWLLGTSQERLMHQLMPALMYVMAQRFVNVQISLHKQKAAKI